MTVRHQVMNSAIMATLKKRMDELAPLSAEEARGLDQLRGRVRELKNGEAIVHERDKPAESCFLLKGLLARAQSSSEGQQQILAISVPQDFCDIQSLEVPMMDHTIAALGPATVAFFPHSELRGLISRHPLMATRFWRQTLIDCAINRQWIRALTQLDALQRLAYLVCELDHRLAAVEMTDGQTFKFSVTQNQVAEILGVTPVHVSRILQEMRTKNLMDFNAGTVEFFNKAELRRLSNFIPEYFEIRAALP